MPSVEPSRQTLTFLRRRFEASGIRLRSKYGQNFLIDLNLLDVLVEAAAVDANDVVLEVGTGTGSLTALLARRAAAVVPVEIDSRMFQLAEEELHRFENVTMLRLDALQNKNRLNSEMLDAVRQKMEGRPGARFKLAANLPYQAAAPLMSNLLELDDPPCRMTVTIQKEMADRMVARPGSKDYGALSVWMQSQCRVEILRTLPPEAFWPRPKVSSAFVQVELDDALRARIFDRKQWHDFIRALFLHRRKHLRSSLLCMAPESMDKRAVDSVLARLGLDGTVRAEQLDCEAMLALCEAVPPARNAD